MGVNGKGTFVWASRRPPFRGVKFNAVDITGNVTQTVFNAADIQYIDSDRRDGSTIVLMKSGTIAHVRERMDEAANQWGQRENVVKYRRKLNDAETVQEVILRVDDITGIDISTRDNFTVLIKCEFAVFPVVGKFEKIVDRASYCRPFAVLHKNADPNPLETAVPVDLIAGVETSHANGTTLIKTPTGRISVVEPLDEAMAVIDRAADEFEDALAAAESGELQKG